MEYTIGVVGRMAEGTDLCDGQTVKTRTLVNELRNSYPKANLRVVDTYDYKCRAVKILPELLSCVKHSQVVFVLLSKRGREVLFPILNYINLFYRKPILHDCIGGALDSHVLEKPEMRKQLNRFVVNWVESIPLKMRLEKLGVNNVEYLPNFKRLTRLQKNELSHPDNAPFRFCTFSRVTEAKGIGRAAEAVIRINQKAGYKRVVLDVYGPIEDNYDRELETYIHGADGAVTYKGVVDYSESVHVLKDYYALLFPTTFVGEGFPGTLIDAFSAGLPVIATNWHCNGEIIEHGKTGYLYEVNEPEQLQLLMEYAIEHSDEIFTMKVNCLEEAQRYDADTVMCTVCAKMEEVSGMVIPA